MIAHLSMSLISSSYFCQFLLGKNRRLKQAKDEATEEIEKYRGEREKQFKEFESKVRKH